MVWGDNGEEGNWLHMGDIRRLMPQDLIIEPESGVESRKTQFSGSSELMLSLKWEYQERRVCENDVGDTMEIST
jgi:hypothetical protein